MSSQDMKREAIEDLEAELQRERARSSQLAYQLVELRTAAELLLDSERADSSDSLSRQLEEERRKRLDLSHAMSILRAELEMTRDATDNRPELRLRERQIVELELELDALREELRRLTFDLVPRISSFASSLPREAAEHREKTLNRSALRGISSRTGCQ